MRQLPWLVLLLTACGPGLETPPATGGTPPKEEVFVAPHFEDSVSGKPSAVQCRKDLPGDIYLSAQMKAEEQGKLINK